MNEKEKLYVLKLVISSHHYSLRFCIFVVYKSFTTLHFTLLIMEPTTNISAEYAALCK